MYAVTDSFLRAVAQSGARKTVVDVYYGTNTDPIASDIPVIGGTLNVDRGSRSRRSGTIQIGDPELLQALEPWGVELAIRTGVVYPNGKEELVPQGKFMIDVESFSVQEGNIPTVDFYDRAQRVYEFSTHITSDADYLGGQFAQSAMDRAILYPAPGYPSSPLWSISYDSSLGNPRLPGGFDQGDTDRWNMAEQIAGVLAAEVYFDRTGNCIVAPQPAITPDTTEADAVWEIKADTGLNDGVLISADIALSREDSYNVILVIGATPAATGARPVYARVFDLNPASKTYYHGAFGKKTLRVENQALTTSAQCLAYANQLLREHTGLTKSVSFGSLCNPALDVGDVILVTYPDGNSDLLMLQSLNIPLGAGNFTGTTRSIQYS